MAGYSIVITKSAAKEIDAIANDKDRKRVNERILRRGDDPRPPGSKKLAGPHERYRIRQGDYRILYSIEDVIRVVSIVRVGQRKDVYRRRRRA